jgi:hypothetical protein
MLGGRGEYVRGHHEVVAKAKTALDKDAQDRSLPPMAGRSPGSGEKRGQRLRFVRRSWTDAAYGSPFDLRLQSSEFGATRVALVGIVFGVIDAKAAKRPSGRHAEQQKRNRRSNQHDRDHEKVTR